MRNPLSFILVLFYRCGVIFLSLFSYFFLWCLVFRGLTMMCLGWISYGSLSFWTSSLDFHWHKKYRECVAHCYCLAVVGILAPHISPPIPQVMGFMTPSTVESSGFPFRLWSVLENDTLLWGKSRHLVIPWWEWKSRLPAQSLLEWVGMRP